MRTYTGLNVNSDFGGRFPWTSQFIDHGGVRQAYVDEGPRDAAVTFLCLHGNPTWSFLYREFIRRLATRQRVIAVDHVGFGRSDKPRDPAYYTIERHSANLEHLLTETRATQVIPILHDWGGPIGMGWAVRHPETVAGVVVLNTTAFVKDPVPNLPWLFQLLAGGWKRAVDNNFFVEWFVGRLGTVRKMTKADLDPYRAPFPTPADRVGMARMPNIWGGAIRATRRMREPSPPKRGSPACGTNRRSSAGPCETGRSSSGISRTGSASSPTSTGRICSPTPRIFCRKMQPQRSWITLSVGSPSAYRCAESLHRDAPRGRKETPSSDTKMLEPVRRNPNVVFRPCFRSVLGPNSMCVAQATLSGVSDPRTKSSRLISSVAT